MVELTAALRAFTRRSAGADVSLVFYAGHGIEMDGVNYLVVPVDAHLERDVDVRFETVPQGGLALTAARPASPNRCHRRGVPSPPPATCGGRRFEGLGHRTRAALLEHRVQIEKNAPCVLTLQQICC